MKIIWIHSAGHVLILLVGYLCISLDSLTYYTHMKRSGLHTFVFTFDVLSHPANWLLVIHSIMLIYKWCWYLVKIANWASVCQLSILLVLELIYIQIYYYSVYLNHGTLCLRGTLRHNLRPELYNNIHFKFDMIFNYIITTKSLPERWPQLYGWFAEFLISSQVSSLNHLEGGNWGSGLENDLPAWQLIFQVGLPPHGPNLSCIVICLIETMKDISKFSLFSCRSDIYHVLEVFKSLYSIYIYIYIYFLHHIQ